MSSNDENDRSEYLEDRDLRNLPPHIRFHIRKILSDDNYNAKLKRSLIRKLTRTRNETHTHKVTPDSDLINTEQRMETGWFIWIVIAVISAIGSISTFIWEAIKELPKDQSKFLKIVIIIVGLIFFFSLIKLIYDITKKFQRWREGSKEQARYKTTMEYLNILNQGVGVWNKWREIFPDVWPDLSGVDLSGVDLCRVNLTGVNLSRANLSGANLNGANLSGANLCRANLFGANLHKANLYSATLMSVDFREANLSEASLIGTEDKTRQMYAPHDRIEAMIYNVNKVVRMRRLLRLITRRYKERNKVRVIKKDGNYIAYNDQTVLDTETGFMWAAIDNGEDIKWHDAKYYCENHRGGGYNDWRMPTMHELRTICRRQGGRSKKNLRTSLIKITNDSVWSGNVKREGAYYLSFTHEDDLYDRHFEWRLKRAIPVRLYIVRVVKKDGNYTTYSDQIVFDAKTGLMWAVLDNGEDIDWHDAKFYCENYRGGGYNDWRLPTVHELRTMYDYLNTRATCIHYWSSDSHETAARYLAIVRGSGAYEYSASELYSISKRVLPVRDHKK